MTTRPVDPTTQPFAEALSRALQSSHLTLETVNARLVELGTPVSPASLSYWQTGRSLPRRASSIRALANLEKILGIQQGALQCLLPRTDGRRVEDLDVRPTLPTINDTIRELDFHAPFWRGIGAADHFVVGADRSEKGLVASQDVVFIRDDVHAMPAIYMQDAAHAVRPTVTPVRGCSLGRVFHFPELHVVIAELVLPRVMHRGERWHVAYEVTCEPTDTPSLRWERALIGHHALYTATVTFEGTPPRAASRYHSVERINPSYDDPIGPSNGDPLPTQGGCLQSVINDAPSGLHGIAWRW